MVKNEEISSLNDALSWLMVGLIPFVIGKGMKKPKAFTEA